MGSIVLPQGLFTVPKISAQFAPNKLAFSSVICRRSLAIATSRYSSSSLKLGKNRNFVVRAEDTAEAVVEESDEIPEIVEAEEKPPRQTRVKLGDVMGLLNKKAVAASENERPIPDLRTGDVVEIKLEVPENKRRLSVYKGIIISRQNAGIHTTIRIRRIIAGVGVEIVFPIYSPNIKAIKVMSHRKVRRARLYYLRDKLPRLSTFK